MTSHRLLPGQRAHPQIAWAKLREGAAIASKKVFAYEKEVNEGLPRRG